MELKEPVKACKPNTDGYLAVIEDADGVPDSVRHFWKPDGTYDGRCSPVKCDTPESDQAIQLLGEIVYQYRFGDLMKWLGENGEKISTLLKVKKQSNESQQS